MNGTLAGLYYIIMKIKIKKKKLWDLMHYWVLMHREIILFLHDSTDTYATRKENVYYVCHNAAMTVAIPNGCPTSTTTRECSSDHKGAQEVGEPTGGSIIVRVDRV